MLRVLLSIVLIFSMSASYGASEAGKCCVPIRMEVTQKTTQDGQLVLAIKLTNSGTNRIRFSIGSGPWVGPDQIQLVAIKLPLGVAIPNELRSMRDPALGYITIDPGKSKEEEVPLRHLYPELAAELLTTKADYVLFWTYQLTTSDAKQSERVGGWLMLPLMLPAKESGSKDTPVVR